MLTDNIQVKGIFEVKIFKKGILIEHYIDNNLVVNLGKDKLCKLIANDGTDHYINFISFGTGTNNPTVVDTTITDDFTKLLDGYTYPSQTSVKFDWTLDTTENNGVTITEFGLRCNDNTLFSRKIRGGIVKEGDVLLEGSWTIKFL